MIKIFSILITLLLVLNACSEKKQNHQASISKKDTSNITKPLPELPKQMYFAGKKVILKDWDIQERLDREVLTNTYLQSATSQIIKRANRWFPIIETILKKEGIHPDFKYLAVIESALIEQAISPVGAEGFWQFMPYTAEDFNLTINDEIDERLDVVKSTKAAAAYLNNANDTLKDWLLAAASYNRGIGGVLRDMKWQKAKSYFDMEQNHETGRYVYRILAMKIIMENPTAYGFNIPKEQCYPAIKTRKYIIKKNIENLSNWAISKGANFKILRKLNPWLRTTKLTIKNKSYTLLLPLNTENIRPYSSYN